MLDPAIELARVMEMQRGSQMRGLAGTVLTTNLGGIGGTPRTELMGR